MIVITDDGVEYFSKTRKTWHLSIDGRDIPQEDYDAMPPWERYTVLATFAECGDEPVRFLKQR